LARKIASAKKEAAKARAGKNSFPQTSFLFARLLNCPICGRGGLGKKKRGKNAVGIAKFAGGDKI